MHKFLQLRIIEAALFAAQNPTSTETLQKLLPPSANIHSILAELQQMYNQRGINLKNIAQGWLFTTADDLAPYLVYNSHQNKKLSRAALEVLAIIAYHQPITRAEIENIRGVSLSRGTLDLIMQIGWIKPQGKKQTPGQPSTWRTTEQFLKHFGLNNPNDLPGIEELKATGLTPAQTSLNVIAMNHNEDQN